jgi:hypothetical protein
MELGAKAFLDGPVVSFSFRDMFSSWGKVKGNIHIPDYHLMELCNECPELNMTKEAIVDHIEHCLKNKNHGKPTPDDVDAILPFAQNEKNGNKVMEILLMYFPFEDDMVEQCESFHELELILLFYYKKDIFFCYSKTVGKF